MNADTKTQNDDLACSCCGCNVPDTYKHNVSFNEVPYPHDNGIGLCRACGGDHKAKTVRDRLGWAACAFYDCRIEILLNKLSPAAADKLKAMEYAKQCDVVGKMIEKGVMI